LERPGRIPANPIEELEKEFDWNWGSDTGSLTDSQVRKLWNEAQTIPEYLLVIGYCIWGLRTEELAQVRVEQFVFDPDDPRIEFTTQDSRKNGIGSVTLLFGLTVLAARLDRLSQDDEWNGYLFPGNTDDGHRHAATLRRRFKTLCKEANITVEGETPTPRDGRSHYFNILGKAETTLLERVSEFAPEQGSKDPETIVERYLDEETRRQYRRVFFRWHQRNVLPDDAFNGPSEVGPHLTNLDDYVSLGNTSQDEDREGEN
jgi:integrase